MQADLADRDFTAERHQTIVISTGATDPAALAHNAQQKAAAQERHADKLAIPRRPGWDAGTSADQLDAQEKQAFLEWRR